MAEVLVCYAGAFLLTFGQHRFEVYIDDTLVKASPGYRRPWRVAVATTPGNHRLEVRAVNRISGWRRSHFFNFDIPRDASYRLGLSVSLLWGSWREPVLEVVAPSNSAQQPTSAPGAPRPMARESGPASRF